MSYLLRLPLFAAIHHYSRLCVLFAIRYSRLFAIQVFQTPVFRSFTDLTLKLITSKQNMKSYLSALHPFFSADHGSNLKQKVVKLVIFAYAGKYEITITPSRNADFR